MSALVVITGPPHSGKTTVLDEIKRRGHAVIPEAALSVINDNDLNASVLDVPAWRAANRKEFQAHVTRRQRTNEAQARNADSPVVFLDRALPDGLAYCRMSGTAPPPELLTSMSMETASYSKVLLFDLVLPFHGRAATGRGSDEATARVLHDALADTYAQLGIAPSVVPLMEVEQRVQHVLERV